MGGSFARTLLPQPVSSATYNAANQQLTFGNQTNSYDLNGSQTSNGTNAYTWNARNSLSGISGPQVSASFQYNGVGQRTGTTINGSTTNYLYAAGSVVQQQSQSGTTNLLTAGNEIYSGSNSSGTSSPLSDGSGSTLSLTDASGAMSTLKCRLSFTGSAVLGAIVITLLVGVIGFGQQIWSLVNFAPIWIAALISGNPHNINPVLGIMLFLIYWASIGSLLSLVFCRRKSHVQL